MRGDNREGEHVAVIVRGSPPHAWGQSSLHPRDGRLCRFTPTCVGTMLSSSGANLSPAVHPHMRGDNQVAAVPVSAPVGSPPHAWGQWCRSVPRSGPYRFTPTCVGTMRRTGSRIPAAPVHPHMRGDNAHSSTARSRMAGSPPHAWGQFPLSVGDEAAFRFTPTCVGTIFIISPMFPPISVHPHMRGDNGGGALFDQFHPRFTPTCVGTM